MAVIYEPQARVSTWTTSTCSTSTAWSIWTDRTASTTATWYTWTTTADSTGSNQDRLWTREPRIVTPAEAAAEAAARRQRVAEEARATEERTRKREAAATRAQQLLLAHLTPEQAESWQRDRLFFVTSQSGRRFRVKRGVTHNLHEVDAEGRELIELCVHIEQVHGCPIEDNLVAQLLALKFDEAALLATANKWDLRAGRRAIPRAA